MEEVIGWNEEEHHCTICLDSLVYPKLLPCQHTFCLSCLVSYMKKADDKKNITCPLCRKTFPVPQEGPDCFLNNYFIHSKRLATLKDGCNVCKYITEVTSCQYCGENFCSECAQNHEDKPATLQKWVAENQINQDEDGSQLPCFRSLQGRIRIKTIAFLFSAFSIGGVKGPVNSMCHNGENQFWIVVRGVTFVVLCDVEGRELRRISLEIKLRCVMYASNHGLLLGTCENLSHNHILIVSSDNTIKHCVNYQPTSIGCFTDGRVVVAALHKDSRDENQGCANIISYSNLDKAEVSLMLPTASFEMTVNTVFGLICLIDKTRNIVLVWSEDGEIYREYTGTFHHQDQHSRSDNRKRFTPSGICCDMEGNIIVFDDSSKIIHVLNPVGEFIGLIVTNHKEGFCNLGCVAIDNAGRLWMGDSREARVRVYEIITYENELKKRK